MFTRNLFVCLLRSPPGTGKTYIGVMLSQIILASTSETILCVCYTNHALDDFLEGLLDAGIRDIVRVGGRSRNERLAEFNIREKAKAGKAPFSREQTRRYAQLKQIIEESGEEVKRIQKICSQEIRKGSWKTLEPFLKQTHLHDWEQLQIDSLTDGDGFKVAGIESDDYLWKRWIAGKDAPAPFEDRNDLPLWLLSKEERRLEKLQWQHEIYEDHRFSLCGSLKAIKNAKDELKQLQDSSDSVILRQSRIIACTTTKAAMCKHLLDDVSAGIVLVEEAAEIFESHILTSLSKQTKRLIMIGDHKQLRPKAQHYPLTVESNRQYDLNRSLFERLAEVLPTSKLGIQHRMHPLISAVPRLTTYPELEDAPHTSNRANVRGLQSRVIFIDHNYAEDVHSTKIEHVDAVSKTNQFEVEMVVACVRYLFQQGYKPTNLVVLTPYLGQLLKIQNALSSTWNVFIDEMDFMEARSFLQGVDGFEPTRTEGPIDSSIRVATIDNYQGEEADIVIASLVRSNADHSIGFLREPERVNVLFSRARACEIIIGNRETLEASRGTYEPLKGGPLWRKILGHLESCGNIFGGLPVVCQSHGEKAVLKTPEEIAEGSPDGGCTKQCSKLLECGHPCTKQCHVGPCVQCAVTCRDTCPRGHTLVKKCSDPGPPKCKHTISWKCPLGHALSGLCYKGKDSSECVGCKKCRQAEEEQLLVEQKLQEALNQKQHELESSRAELGAAERDKLHQEQLNMIEEEKALVQRRLVEIRQPDASTDEFSFLSDLDDMVRTHLHKSESGTALVSDIASIYQKRRGRDLQIDANRHMGKDDGTKMSFRLIFDSLDCCEIVPSAKRNKNKRRKRGLTVKLLQGKVSDSFPSSNEDGASHSRPETVRVDVAGDQQKAVKKSRLDKNTIPEICMEDATEKEEHENSTVDGQANQLSIGSGPDIVLTRTENASLGVPEGEPPKAHSTSQSVHEFDMSATVSDVVKRFINEGALAADNLLDEIKAEPGFRMSSELKSLEYIIGEELDPSGTRSRPPPKPEVDSSLCQAVCLYAHSLYCSLNGCPLQSQQSADKVLAILKNKDLPFPQQWIERTQHFIPIPNHVTKVKQSEQVDSPQDKWALVLTSDRNAPSVMQDSVLPLIGLTKVKNSLIGMYHRIKVAQEQNDGAGASYNIRFEGNPGTGYDCTYCEFIENFL